MNNLMVRNLTVLILLCIIGLLSYQFIFNNKSIIHKKEIKISTYLMHQMNSIDKDSDDYNAQYVLSKDTLIASSVYLRKKVS